MLADESCWLLFVFYMASDRHFCVCFFYGGVAMSLRSTIN